MLSLEGAHGGIINAMDGVGGQQGVYVFFHMLLLYHYICVGGQQGACACASICLYVRVEARILYMC
jgi:hypothetical protein